MKYINQITDFLKKNCGEYGEVYIQTDSLKLVKKYKNITVLPNDKKIVFFFNYDQLSIKPDSIIDVKINKNQIKIEFGKNEKIFINVY